MVPVAEPHVHEPRELIVTESARRLLLAVMVPLLAAILVGLVVLWPGTLRTDSLTDALAPDDLFVAKVVSVTVGPCANTEPESAISCEQAEVELQEGPDDGAIISLFEEPVTAGWDLDRGEEIILAYYPDAGEGFEYSLVDRERRAPLLLLAVIFAAAVIGLARWKGARSLLGVAISLAVLATFILPSLLDGNDPVAVALVGAGLIAVLALYLSHGVNAGSTVALVGAFASLALVGVLAWGFIELTDLTGRAAEEAGILQISASQVRLQGLLLAGIVIGTLGVLDDVTVLQVSAVWELRQANPDLGRRDLYGAAVRIGRDHIASTVNTLFLAYAGASLPLFLLLTQAQTGLSDTANSEVVAVEIIRTLVGSIGLVAAVPITTLLAVWIVDQRRPGRAPRSDPRRYRSRTERELWAGATDEPTVPPPPPDRAM